MQEILYQMIFKRKSFHTFKRIGDTTITDQEIDDIYKVYDSFQPLQSDIKTKIRIVPGHLTTSQRGQEYCILFYSELKDHYLQNTGYLGEQLDLYLVSKNIGTLWFGIGKTYEESSDGLEFVIMMAIKKVENPTDFRKNMFKSKRKPLDEIWHGNTIEGVSDIIRFTPSACNTQPWLIKNGDTLNIYRYKKPGKRGIMPKDKVTYYNRIDIGILLCMMDLCLKHCEINYQRILFEDKGNDDEYTLYATYQLNLNNTN